MKATPYLPLLLGTTISTSSYGALQEISIDQSFSLGSGYPLHIIGSIIFDDSTLVEVNAFGDQLTTSYVSFSFELDLPDSAFDWGEYVYSGVTASVNQNNANSASFSLYLATDELDPDHLEIAFNATGIAENVFDMDPLGQNEQNVPVSFTLAIDSINAVGLVPMPNEAGTLDDFSTVYFSISEVPPVVVPVPAAAWLFISAVGGLVGLRRFRAVHQ